MKNVATQLLTGGEYLAKPVILKNNQTLYYEGTCLYMKHIEKLIEMGVDEVCIFEPNVLSLEEKKNICELLHKECLNKISVLLKTQINQSQIGIKEIAETAQEIIDNIFCREKVVDRLYDIKERSIDLYQHSVMVAGLSILTAIKMGLSRWEVTEIGIGSLMHDMGLRYLTISYDNVSEEEMDVDSFFEYRKHTLYGFSSVEKESWMSTEIKNIILFHHERVNGTGYPFKQQILSLPVKIVAVVDAYTDIICGVGCKKDSIGKALEYIKYNRDTLFDGRTVDYFLEMIASSEDFSESDDLL